MIMRMLGAARLSVDTYEDVEKDSSATKQALIVVVLVSIAAGVGALLAGEEAGILRGLGFGIIRGVVSWAVWALVAMFIGTKILRTEETEANWGQVARCTGFAQTPGLLNVLVFLSGFITVVAFVWQLIAMVIAVRQSLDYKSSLRAFFVILIALIPVAIINAIIFTVLNL